MGKAWLGVLAVLVLSAARAGGAEAPRWWSDYDEARKLALRTGRPLFVVFRCEH